MRAAVRRVDQQGENGHYLGGTTPAKKSVHK